MKTKIFEYSDSSRLEVLKLTYSTNKPIITSNQMYLASVKADGKPYITKSVAACEYQRDIIESFKKSGIYDIPKSKYEDLFSDLIGYQLYMNICKNKSGWFYKNGKMKKIDLENIIKVFHDALIKVLNKQELRDSEMNEDDERYNYIDDSLCSDQFLSKVIDDDLGDGQTRFEIIIKLLKR